MKKLQPLHIIKNAKALCWLSDDIILLYKNSSFFEFDLSKNKKMFVTKMVMNKKENIFSVFGITRRLFRLYPNSPCYNSKSHDLYFTFDGWFFTLNTENNRIHKEVKLKHRASRLLSICLCRDGLVYYGEYSTKNDCEPISIYKRWCDGRHEIVYSFKPNEIRHIHLLKEHNNNLYCFTGDETKQIKIVVFVNKNFSSEPLPLLTNKQQYRTCFATINNGKLFYVTDNPYSENHIYSYNIESKELLKLYPVEGSVIYGLEDDDGFYFSTSVEKNLGKDKNGKNVRIRIDGVSGGIRSKQSFLYYYKFKDNSIKVLYSLKKDLLPIKLFGLGSFIFTCNNSNKYLAVTSSSLAKNSSCLFFDIINGTKYGNNN